ncbi:MAG: bifunctional [glutamine synthetase] adenylyltransferase/[glutamine synthetase]-adenylyl-L-tyrosine phosphorylase [Alphaproteobacteria bacterium]
MSDIEVRDNAIERAINHAPYLAESLTLFPEIKAQFLAENPEHIFSNLAKALPLDVGDLDAEMPLLRVFKRRAHLAIALLDLAEIWDWAEVTEHVTQLADICMSRLLQAIGKDGGIDGTPDNPVPGLFVLAVGKYGARELNYSSDIDFNVFYAPESVVLPNPARAERDLIKVVQSLIKGFERITGEGYIFRTDLRLRPDPRSNAVAVSTHTAERYYETLGQNWERAAMIKARVCGGDHEAGQAFIDTVLTPFIWRRNLDYAAIDDILAIKRQIHAGKGGMHIHVPGHHLKLGKGGIREVEFYAQVQQLILGGREPNLRCPRTLDALGALSSGGFIEAEDAKALSAHYAILRTWEHRAQMVDDAQTHYVPADEAERDNFAALCGYESRQTFEGDVLEVLTDVHTRYVDLFPDMETLSSREGSLVFTGVEAGPATLETLSRLGYENAERVWRSMADWLGGRIRATKTERAREYLTALAPGLIDMCADTGQPDRAFEAFARFFTNLQGGVTVLSMFCREPERLAQLISLMSRSSRVADMLSANTAILDAMSDPAFMSMDEAGIIAEYGDNISGAGDFEEVINAARRQVREDHFRVTTGLMTKTITADKAALLFTAIADATMQALLPAAILEVERVAGPVKGYVGVIGMGKMGGRELRLTSDLDIMLIYEPSEEDANPQRLYTKITQRLINALSAVTEEGGLYEVDMALRPSGRSGPVAVTIDSFKRYYAETAWTWEFMALSRGRIIAVNDPAFFPILDESLTAAITAQRPDLAMPEDIADMLTRTKAEKVPRDAWDIKNCEGGLRDAEYIAQAFYLSRRAIFRDVGRRDSIGMIRTACDQGLIDEKKTERLVGALSFFNSLSQVLAMIMSSPEDNSPRVYEAAGQILSYGSVADLIRDRDRHCRFVSKLTKTYIYS